MSTYNGRSRPTRSLPLLLAAGALLGYTSTIGKARRYCDDLEIPRTITATEADRLTAAEAKRARRARRSLGR